jgi:NADH-quinone oxidoreductase subunit G
VAHSPALAFLHAGRSTLELGPADAQRLELLDGDRVVVGSEGETTEATVKLRAAVPQGSAFLAGNAVDGPFVDVRKAVLAESSTA